MLGFPPASEDAGEKVLVLQGAEYPHILLLSWRGIVLSLMTYRFLLVYGKIFGKGQLSFMTSDLSVSLPHGGAVQKAGAF